MVDKGISAEDLETIFSDELLRIGAPASQASLYSKALADKLHATCKGKRLVFRIGRTHMKVLSPDARVRIFRIWVGGEMTENQICTEFDISRSTLNRIKGEGRMKSWGGTRNG